MISFLEANKIINAEFKNLLAETEQVEILDSLNRILSKDILPDIYLPPFNNSAMDGIAIKFNPEIKKWKIAGEVLAGNFLEYNLDDSSCVQIMTGGKLPSCFDTVIPIEDLTFENDFAFINENTKIKLGQNIRKLGEDLNQNEIAVKKNIIISAKHISLAAACGLKKIFVYKQLKIGVIATGDELVEIDVHPTDDKIRNSNLYAILSAVKEMNMLPFNLGTVKDEKNILYNKFKSALEMDLDILITTGGVSVGKHDYVKDIFENLGIETKFWRVNIKPGKPIVFGIYKNQNKNILVFGLPGNPVSSFINFLIFIKKNIYSFFGVEGSDRIFPAKLLHDVKKKDDKKHFSRGLIHFDKKSSKNYVELIGSQSSGNMVGLANANCLIVLEEERINPMKGEIVECILI